MSCAQRCSATPACLGPTSPPARLTLAPKKFTGGLTAGPLLRHQAARDTVCASDFARKFAHARIRLEFPEGPVPFEVNDHARDILGKIATMLPPCPPRA